MGQQNDYHGKKKVFAPQDRGQPYRPRTKTYPMPQDVTSLIGGASCQNFSLRFYRFVPGEEGKNAKIISWNAIRDAGNALCRDNTAQRFLERQSFLADSLRKIYGDNCVIDWQKGQTVSRLSIGFGDTGPLDTGMTLHRLYGLPYLPASAVKGVCRAWALDNMALELGVPRLTPKEIEKLKKEPEKENRKTPMTHMDAWLLSDKNKDGQKKWDLLRKSMEKGKYGSISAQMPEDEWSDHFRRIFGSQDGRGEVHFHDAFPAEIPARLFDLDIINVHYQTYYESKGITPPADYLSPVPIFFLTVAPGVPFRFVLTCRNHALLASAKDCLTDALADFGIGAKTSLGYGAIEEISEQRGGK